MLRDRMIMAPVVVVYIEGVDDDPSPSCAKEARGDTAERGDEWGACLCMWHSRPRLWTLFSSPCSAWGRTVFAALRRSAPRRTTGRIPEAGAPERHAQGGPWARDIALPLHTLRARYDLSHLGPYVKRPGCLFLRVQGIRAHPASPSPSLTPMSARQCPRMKRSHHRDTESTETARREKKGIRVSDAVRIASSWWPQPCVSLWTAAA